MVDGNIDINRKSFEIKYLDTLINKYSKCLNIIVIIYDDKTITKSITEDYFK